ncbi:LysR family transcriptional regulator [Defluviitalea phaphyphila]|uniref:LysR family transcriptional regulator n=1 Tax=Defluviitalea phaphyphila TaxID=1473580 RepID=UPI000730A986|nr:LysR family transcriptional regulator [Defluviitalea phaphyphila]
MDVNFELYKVFFHVASTLSFSEAANKLFISQSAVSQSIKALEEKLNTQLFFRNTKQVKLTKDGEILFLHIEKAYNLIKNAERNINEIHSLEQGEIRIGASDTICKYYLLPYLKKFHLLYPKIKILITNGTSPKCVEFLKQGNVDFIVSNIPNNYVENSMEIKNIKPIQDVFIAGMHFKELKNKKVSLKDLEKYPFLMLEKKTTTRDFFDSVLKENNINIIPEIELGSIDLLVEMSKIGLGITFVWEECIINQLKNKEIFIVDVAENIPKRGIGVITHKQIPLSTGAKKFIELLKV